MKLLDTLKGIGPKTWNTLKGLGPFLISQSEKASELFQRHQGRLAEVEALKELLKGEVETRVQIRRTLLEKIIAAPPEDRVRIEQDLEYIDGVTRQLNIYAKSLSYSNTKDSTVPESTEPPKPIGDHWIDHFNALARLRNEEWRQELLARALAAETAKPGSVSPRALWLIGNLEEAGFKALSKLLDLCVWTWPTGEPFIPDSKLDALARELDPADPDSHEAVGHLTFRLGDAGILGHSSLNSLRYTSGVHYVVRYDQDAYVLVPKQQISVRGVLLTSLGDSIAKFYDPQWNANGRAIFNDWIESLKDKADVQPFEIPKDEAAS